MRGVFGFVPNLGYALAAEPPALAAYITMLQSLAATSLDPIAQQVAMVAASRANAADYGVAVHATLAAKLGGPTDIVEALRNGKPLQDPKLEAVRGFAAAIASKRTQVSDSDVNALRAAGYDHRAVVAIALAAAAKNFPSTRSPTCRGQRSTPASSPRRSQSAPSGDLRGGDAALLIVFMAAFG